MDREAAFLMDAQEAGAALGYTARTMLELARRGDIGHVRLGRRVRFTRQDIEDYIEAHRVGAGMVRSARSRAAHRRRAS